MKTTIKYDEIEYNNEEVYLKLNGEVVETLYLDCIIPEFLKSFDGTNLEYKDVR